MKYKGVKDTKIILYSSFDKTGFLGFDKNTLDNGAGLKMTIDSINESSLPDEDKKIQIELQERFYAESIGVYSSLSELLNCIFIVDKVSAESTFNAISENNVIQFYISPQSLLERLEVIAQRQKVDFKGITQKLEELAKSFPEEKNMIRGVPSFENFYNVNRQLYENSMITNL